MKKMIKTLHTNFNQHLNIQIITNILKNITYVVKLAMKVEKNCSNGLHSISKLKEIKHVL